MGKCASCRQREDELDTPWDRVRMFLFHFFHRDIEDLSQEKYTQGFGDGYKIGKQHGERGVVENRPENREKNFIRYQDSSGYDDHSKTIVESGLSADVQSVLDQSK